MKRIPITFIALLAYLTIINFNSYSQSSDDTQGGILEFNNTVIERFGETSRNVDSLLLKNYTGLPLKALQFKLIVGTKGKLILKSVERGSGIPASSFWFDYEIYKGKKHRDGSSIDTVIALFLGNGENVLLPGRIHHIISINYDIAPVDVDINTSLRLVEVVGATSTPVKDANITAGQEANIFLRKYSVNNKELNLHQNFPNPFNPVTKISYSINKAEHITLKIFNTLGEEISTLADEYKTPGFYEQGFDASGLPSGIYLYRLQSGSFTETRKMLLIK